MDYNDNEMLRFEYQYSEMLSSVYKFSTDVTSFYAYAEDGERYAVGGHYFQTSLRNDIKDFLENTWGITDMDTAHETIDNMLSYGHRSKFRSYVENDEDTQKAIEAIERDYGDSFTLFKTKFKELKKLGVEEEKAWICANMRNGNWYCGSYFILQTVFNNKKLHELGYPTFTEFYLKICEN